MPVQVLQPGSFNANQGPDFSTARIRIGNTLWIGNVELHIKSSDWNRHGHTADQHYQSVILHVVWENDTTVNEVPVLVLHGRVPLRLLEKYQALQMQLHPIPCESLMQPVPVLIWQSWRDRLLLERLQRKQQHIQQLLLRNRYNWEETCWWLLARNFGMKVNADAFEAIAQSLPLSILARQKHSLLQLEALLMGQAGMLSKQYADEYPRQLQAEYKMLALKYQLRPVLFPLHLLRMRPVNFPTIRLAQLAALLHRQNHLFAFFRETGQPEQLHRLLSVEASSYWHTHYLFDEPSIACEKRVGATLVHSIVINTLGPLLFAYGQYRSNHRLQEKAIDWLNQSLPENNKVVRACTPLGFPAKDAGDTQALLEMQAEYCSRQRCLECSIGHYLLRQPESS